MDIQNKAFLLSLGNKNTTNMASGGTILAVPQVEKKSTAKYAATDIVYKINKQGQRVSTGMTYGQVREKNKAKRAAVKKVLIAAGVPVGSRSSYANKKPSKDQRPPRSTKQAAAAADSKTRLDGLANAWRNGGKMMAGKPISWKDYVKANSTGKTAKKKADSKAATAAKRQQYPAYYAWLDEKRVRKANKKLVTSRPYVEGKLVGAAYAQAYNGQPVMGPAGLFR